MCASISSRDTPPSRFPREKANPAEVVASASNPRCSKKIAVPMSQGFGSTKHPDSCIARNFPTTEEWCAEFIPKILYGSNSSANLLRRISYAYGSLLSLQGRRGGRGLFRSPYHPNTYFHP